ncbi:MAG TPA: heme lyase CcmF/NrfE family subunit [Anaerolineales bacterium]|nr:heme lyase CcmF/NrfE family subunit [Anaerolineales bacterium]
MVAHLGYGVLLLTFVVSLYSAAAAVYGALRHKAAWVESARRAAVLTFPLLTLSSLALLYLLLTDHFEIAYVASVSSRVMPLYLKITAFWGSQAGSLLFWSWLMSAFASAVMLRPWDRDREFLPWVTMVTMVTLAFFLFLTAFAENPFARLWALPNGDVVEGLLRPQGSMAFIPRDGEGLNPLLRHPGMIWHPPFLYLGFVSFVIPYAFGLAALITRRTDDRWIRLTRRWTLTAWLFLSIGLVLGMRWAYDVLGWGGYWGWDPVEIAALMPWLTGTAFLHSVIIQEKRGMFKRWNMVLIILTYSLMIFGTFLTRSGVLSSVHSFAQSAIGPLFFAFIGITFIASLTLLTSRWADLKSENEVASFFSREALFAYNNLVFIGILVVCFWGVIFPLFSELVTGQKVTVGPPFYERATAPLFALMLLLMGIAPLSAWGYAQAKTIGRHLLIPVALSPVLPVLFYLRGMRAWGALLGFWLVNLVAAVILYEYVRAVRARVRRTGESLPRALAQLIARNRRRYGGYIIHLGIVLMALGVIGIEMFQVETQGTIPVGGSLSLGPYTMVYDNLAEFPASDGRIVARATISVYKNGTKVAELHPRRDFYIDARQPMTIPGVRSTWEDDFYVILVDWEPISSQGATFKVFQNPLVSWLWLGTFVFIFGTLLALWPTPEPRPAVTASRPRRVGAKA